MVRSGLVLIAATSLLSGKSAAAEIADLVLRGGTIVTCDAGDRQVESLAVRGERIAAAGSAAEIEKWIGPATRVIDLRGRTVVPGFIEGHGHFLSLGETKLGLDLSQLRSWNDVVEQVAAAVRNAPPGDWIIGRGWHQEKWTPPAYPTHHDLSRVAPDNPVLLIHGTGHMSLANAAAMKAAGMTRETQPPPGGEILRDHNGEPTGVFRETAQAPLHAAHRGFLSRRSPDEVEADLLRAIERAGRECLANGVTSFHDAGSSPTMAERYHKLADAGRLPVRLWIMLRGSPAELEEHLVRCRTVDRGNGFLTVRAIKCMADGALGSHGAWLLEPYSDLPQSAGLVVQPIDEIRRTALLALEHNYQLCTHAIGDRANREVLDLYEVMFRSHPRRKDLRWRIEHAQHLHPADVPRFAEIGVIASIQTCHATSDGRFVAMRLGEERARSGAYVWRSLLDAETRVVNGTDAPVEDLSPIRNFHAAVTRRMADERAFYPEQRMTREEALRSMTIDAAWGAFEEDSKGSLEPGKLADMVVLSRNLLTVAEDDILTIEVDGTILGGRVAYERR